MSRIPIPTTIEAAPTASQPLLAAVQKQLGIVPNVFRLVSNSPAALEGYLGLIPDVSTLRVIFNDGSEWTGGEILSRIGSWLSEVEKQN